MPDAPLTTPLEVFEAVRARALTILKTTFMESGRAWPGDDAQEVKGMLLPVLGIGIAAATEYYGEHPEYLALSRVPICTVCREPIQSLQVGVDPSRDADTTVVKLAWPCGHYQS